MVFVVWERGEGRRGLVEREVAFENLRKPMVIHEKLWKINEHQWKINEHRKKINEIRWERNENQKKTMNIYAKSINI